MSGELVQHIEDAGERYIRACADHAEALARHSCYPFDGGSEARYYQTAIDSRAAWAIVTALIGQLGQLGFGPQALRLQAEIFRQAGVAELRAVRGVILAELSASTSTARGGVPCSTSHAA